MLSEYEGLLERKLKEELPWLGEVRSWQWDGYREIIEAYARGAKVVVLDAPTGAGKTLIAEMVRRKLAHDARREDKRLNALYMCSTLSLQDQFMRSFPYANVLKGKRNYVPLLNTPLATFNTDGVTCDDCEIRRELSGGLVCPWCAEISGCPYKVAKREAVMGELAVVNTAYALREWSGEMASALSGAGLVIADEMHLIEDAIVGFVEYKVTGWRARGLGLTIPKKGSHMKTIKEWMGGELLSALEMELEKYQEQDDEDLQYVSDFMDDEEEFPEGEDVAGIVAAQLERGRKERELKSSIAGLRGVIRGMEVGEWVRNDHDEGGKYKNLTLNPVRVDEHGERALWRHGQRWLCMSATVISAAQRIRDLGFEGEWDVVYVPMQFEVENRRVWYAGVSEVTRKGGDEAVEKMIDACVKVCRMHEGESVLVHGVSYVLCERIAERLRWEYGGNGGNGENGGTRRVITYGRGKGERETAIGEFRRSRGSVIVAPSLDTGVDFPDNECRVQVIAKMPWPNLGDKRTSALVNSGHVGQTWFTMKTVEGIVQMCGRAVRHEKDFAVTYILDASFKKVYDENRGLFPKWFRDAVSFRFNMREAGLK